MPTPVGAKVYDLGQRRQKWQRTPRRVARSGVAISSRSARRPARYRIVGQRVPPAAREQDEIARPERYQRLHDFLHREPTKVKVNGVNLIYEGLLLGICGSGHRGGDVSLRPPPRRDCR